MNVVKKTIKRREKCSPYTRTTSWDLLPWPFLTQEWCLVLGQASSPCSPPPEAPVPICLRFSRLQTCHTCPHKWCTEGPCSPQTGSGCLCPFLLAAPPSTDIPPWNLKAWMMKWGILETELRGFHIQPSTEGGGRWFLFLLLKNRYGISHCDVYSN